MPMDEYTPEDSPSAQQEAGVAPAFETVEPEQVETAETAEGGQEVGERGTVGSDFDLDESYRQYRRSQPPEPLERLEVNTVSIRALSRSVDDWVSRNFPDEGYGLDVPWAVERDPRMGLLVRMAKMIQSGDVSAPESGDEAAELFRNDPENPDHTVCRRGQTGAEPDAEDPQVRLLLHYFTACHDTSPSGMQGKVWISTEELLEKYLEWCEVAGLEEQNSTSSITGMGRLLAKAAALVGYVDVNTSQRRQYLINVGKGKMRSGRKMVPFVSIGLSMDMPTGHLTSGAGGEARAGGGGVEMPDEPCEARRERAEVPGGLESIAWYESLRWHILECYEISGGSGDSKEGRQRRGPGTQQVWTPTQVLHSRYLEWCRVSGTPVMFGDARRFGKALGDMSRSRPMSMRTQGGSGPEDPVYVPEAAGRFVNGGRRGSSVRISGWFVPSYRYSR